MVRSTFFNNTQLHEHAKMVIKVTIVLSPEFIKIMGGGMAQWVARLTHNRQMPVSPEFELPLVP